MIDAFYDRVDGDDLVSRFFPGGVHEIHRDHVAAWWAEVFGGPARYITPEARHRFVSLMSLAAEGDCLHVAVECLPRARAPPHLEGSRPWRSA